MVHRDIKPENVLLVEEESAVLRPMLLDFGIARDLDAGDSTTTAAGRIRGTPAYMAPERFFGKPATVLSDVYELAVTLFAMLTGSLPWTADGDVSERLAPRSPRDLGVVVPAALGQAIQRSLSTRPEVRASSAEALAEEVERGWQEREGAASHATVELDARTEPRAGSGLDALAPTLVDVTRPRPLAALSSPTLRSNGPAGHPAIAARPPLPSTPSLQGTAHTQPERPARSSLDRARPVFMLGGLVAAGVVVALSSRPAVDAPAVAALPIPTSLAEVTSSSPSADRRPAPPVSAVASQASAPSSSPARPSSSRGRDTRPSVPTPSASARPASSSPASAASAGPRRDVDVLFEDRR